MIEDRWVVLGLAHPRAGWFSELARWTTTAAVPIDFLKCVSAEEVRARLHDGRTYSALLVGGDVASLDRDLVDTARACGAAVLVVGRHGRRDWKELGVSALLPEVLERHELLAALTEHAPPVTSVEQLVVADPDDTDGSWRGRLVAVTGPGGAGVSVSAMALAQGLASDASNRGLVLLADLALDAEQSMLHDARELVPGVQELVEGHRGGRLPPDEIRALVFDAAGRGYHLLLGLRRHRDWTAIRPRALEAGLDGLLRCYRLVVADIDPDLEGEAETGSLDIGDRNLMARTVAERADLVVVVGTDGVKGLHALARTIRAMLDGGVPVDRIVPTVTRAPRSPRRRAETTAALARLVDGRGPAAGNPVFLPERHDLEDALRDGVRLPPVLGRSITTAVRCRLEHLAPRRVGSLDAEPVAVSPGSLGSWSEETG